MNFMLSGLLLAATLAASGPTGAAGAAAKTNRVARITSASTYYDSKEGVAFFAGKVFVDDDEYQLHADKAYVFMDKTGTNDVKRIVALGNVSLTNGTKRAYGDKVSYHRAAGMVVLYAPEGGVCEVRDEKSDPPQSVKGSKIKFWLGSEQVQVEKAAITAPVTGESVNGLKGVMGN